MEGTEQTTHIDPAFDALVKNQRLMQDIAREMKEIPELPSERPTDVSPLTKVEFPVEGGILTYMEGNEYPYKGFPFAEFVDRIDTLKKLSRGFVSALFHSFKNKKFLLLLIFIPLSVIFRHLVRAALYTFYRQVDRSKLKPIRYCDAVREIHRIFSGFREFEGENENELRLMLRDSICMLLEFDNAYRFRMQDVLIEIDQKKLKKKPIKEIVRLFSILQQRELTQEIKDTWTLVKLMISLYLRFDRQLLKIIVDALSQVNKDKLKLSTEDVYYCRKRTDYKFAHQCAHNT